MITAKLKHLRISPRKVRLVTNLVKGLNIKEARQQLRFVGKRASEPVSKLLNSAVANAKNNAGLEEENLYISNITVDPGATLKRWRPRAMGRASSIMKRTSHITLTLKELVPSTPKKSRRKAEIPTPEDVGKTKTESLPQSDQPVEKIEEEKTGLPSTKSVPPPKPYRTTSQSKKKFFSRQTFGNAKKFFRRKSM